jgi:GTP cyclohydrolase I
MKQEDLKKAPKLFCESINIAYTPEFFVMGLSSGTQASIYSLTPQHAKRLMQYITHQMQEYEKEHGAVTATWSPTIVSPVQRKNPPTDLS